MPTVLDIVEELFEKGVFENQDLADKVEEALGKRPPNNTLANYRSLFRRFGSTWRQELRSMNRQWAKDNPEKKLEGSRAWGHKNPARMLLGQAKQRAKRLKVLCTLTEQDIALLLEGMTCSVTGIPLNFTKHNSESLKNPWTPSLDRINRHLGYAAGNVRLVCRLFNHMRGDYSDEDVMRVAQALVGVSNE